MMMRTFLTFFLSCAALTASALADGPDGQTDGQADAPDGVVFENVRIFDGTSQQLSGPSSVLVRGNRIVTISSDSIEDSIEIGDGDASPTRIDGGGRTLMPGLIDVHVHLTFGAMSVQQMHDPSTTLEVLEAASADQAEKMLMRGFTAVRDAGGPVFSLKSGIDAGRYVGPRIWPSGALISQTAGHGDMRLPSERSRRFFGEPSKAELMGASFIADGRAEVLTAVRENLRFGASQIKITAGGGTSSAYDPLDVTQYTAEEMRAAVEAAEDWGTYVTTHAYTPRAVRRAVEAGVKVIEHGQLLDEETLQLLVNNDVWLSSQMLVASTPDMDPLRRAKRKPLIDGQSTMWPMARDLGVKLAWGTDFLFEPELNEQQNAYALSLAEVFGPAGLLKLLTHDNARLLALSGLRSPYEGTLGVVEEGALADLILVDGDPLADIELIGNPADNFLIIMKDGKIYKNAMK